MIIVKMQIISRDSAGLSDLNYDNLQVSQIVVLGRDMIMTSQLCRSQHSTPCVTFYPHQVIQLIAFREKLNLTFWLTQPGTTIDFDIM